jgi:hypothetical protein
LIADPGLAVEIDNAKDAKNAKFSKWSSKKMTSASSAPSASLALISMSKGIPVAIPFAKAAHTGVSTA